LSWLCWAVGTNGLALPDALAQPPRLAGAIQVAVSRCWRACDRLRTGGLLARSNGVQGFEWQGIDIDMLPPHLVEVAAAEYLATRSMFLWLVTPDTLSPFQDDLREV
jgi:hypothetical protein